MRMEGSARTGQTRRKLAAIRKRWKDVSGPALWGKKKGRSEHVDSIWQKGRSRGRGSGGIEGGEEPASLFPASKKKKVEIFCRNTDNDSGKKEEEGRILPPSVTGTGGSRKSPHLAGRRGGRDSHPSTSLPVALGEEKESGDPTCARLPARRAKEREKGGRETLYRPLLTSLAGIRMGGTNQKKAIAECPRGREREEERAGPIPLLLLCSVRGKKGREKPKGLPRRREKKKKREGREKREITRMSRPTCRHDVGEEMSQASQTDGIRERKVGETIGPPGGTRLISLLRLVPGGERKGKKGKKKRDAPRPPFISSSRIRRVRKGKKGEKLRLLAVEYRRGKKKGRCGRRMRIFCLLRKKWALEIRIDSEGEEVGPHPLWRRGGITKKKT